jgi:hypothetical protein
MLEPADLEVLLQLIIGYYAKLGDEGIGWAQNTKHLRRKAPVLKSPEIGTLYLLCARVLSVSLVEGHN